MNKKKKEFERSLGGQYTIAWYNTDMGYDTSSAVIFQKSINLAQYHLMRREHRYQDRMIYNSSLLSGDIFHAEYLIPDDGV